MEGLSEREVAAYREDGAVCLRHLFGAEWLELLARGVDKDKAAPGPLVRYNTPDGNPGEFFVDFCMWQRLDEFRRFVFESPAAEVAARMMGAGTVNFYHDHLLVKEPGTLERTPWHQDLPYYPLEGDQVCSIWLPLDPVPRPICPEFVRGSHRWGRRFQPRYFKDRPDADLAIEDNPYEPVPDVDGQRGDYELLSWELEPGDCIVFHALALHGAPDTATSARRRRGYATRWLGEGVTYAARQGQISPPIEGHGLAPGDPVDCAMFPRVWPRAAPAKRGRP